MENALGRELFKDTVDLGDDSAGKQNQTTVAQSVFAKSN